MRILSGIQPSGTIHIGNYFGMIKKMIESQNEGELFAFLASYHALTSVKVKEALENKVATPAFVEVDTNKLTGKLTRLPERSELNSEINEALIVEYYNRLG